MLADALRYLDKDEKKEDSVKNIKLNTAEEFETFVKTML